jgi:flagellar export protein FliJ
MSFDFKLEKVRTQRRRVVDVLARELAECRHRFDAIEAGLAALEDNLAANLAEAAATGGQMPRVADMIAKTAWLDHLRLRREALGVERDAAGHQLNETRSRLHEAWRELEIINGLRDQHRAHWLTRLVRRETKQMDEIAGVHGHRGRHGGDTNWADPRISVLRSASTGEGRPS